MSDDLEAIRRSSAESVLLLGGGAAILLQLADERVARGVRRHSDFAGRPLDRLVGTIDYLYGVVYADEPGVRASVRRVNRAHATVHGDADESGVAYNAFDAESQLWVVATLYRTATHFEELLFGPRDEEDADRLYRDYAILGTRLQLPAESWPESRAAFERYWQDRIDGASISEDARHVARALLFPSALPAPLRAVMPPVRLLTAGLLPEPVRLGFGIRWTPRAERVFQGWLRVIRLIYPRLPRAIRQAPRDRSLHRLRRRLRYAGAERRNSS